ncbi:MAG: hypothetical protein AAGL98_03630, partial [Planctomycetota bacterium]
MTSLLGALCTSPLGALQTSKLGARGCLAEMEIVVGMGEYDRRLRASGLEIPTFFAHGVLTFSPTPGEDPVNGYLP